MSILISYRNAKTHRSIIAYCDQYCDQSFIHYFVCEIAYLRSDENLVARERSAKIDTHKFMFIV